MCLSVCTCFYDTIHGGNVLLLCLFDSVLDLPNNTLITQSVR